MIDYGRNLECNRNPETGIRYGILPTNHPRLSEWFWESVEAEYDPHCPHCGRELVNGWEETGLQYAKDNAESEGEDAPDEDARYCPHCLNTIDDDAEYPEEPTAQVLEGEETGFVDSSGDIWVTDSPYYTRACPCSPCAPGAAYLSSVDEDGLKAYCLGPEWFADDTPPYPVFRVDDDSLVHPGATD